jgi:malate synthase
VFGGRRKELLDACAPRRAQLADGGTLDFLSETQDVREGDWMVALAPTDLQRRWVEITVRPTALPVGRRWKPASGALLG